MMIIHGFPSYYSLLHSGYPSSFFAAVNNSVVSECPLAAEKTSMKIYCNHNNGISLHSLLSCETFTCAKQETINNSINILVNSATASLFLYNGQYCLLQMNNCNLCNNLNMTKCYEHNFTAQG